MTSPQKIAVTGANGFIGAHCVLALLDAGFGVVAVVRDPTNESKTKFLIEEANKIGKKDSLTFASGDLYKNGSYDDAFEGSYGVLHTAAVVDLGDVADAYAKVVKPAVDGTKNVIGSVKKNSSSIERFVNISSCAAVSAYDKESGHVFKDDDWNTYSTVENGDAYGYAKTQAEKAVWDDKELQSCTTVVSLNPTVVLGQAYTKSHATASSASLVTSVLQGGETMSGVSLSFVNVKDVAKGAVLAFTQDKELVGGKRFLLSCSKSMDGMDLNDIVKKFHPTAKGAIPSVHPFVFKIVCFLGEYLPFLRDQIQYKDIWKYSSRLREFDTTQSKTVLGIGEYISLEDTCKEAAGSILPFLKEEEPSQ